MPTRNLPTVNRQLAELLSALNARHWPAWTLESGPTLVDGRTVVRLKVDYCLRGLDAPPMVIEVRLTEGELSEVMVEAVNAAGIPTWAR